MENPEIKACPFCGEHPTVEHLHEQTYAVRCKSGESHSHEANALGLGKEMAIARWNRRAGDRQPVTPEPKELKALASATCSAAPPELVEAMKEINRHIEHLEHIGTISVTGSLLAARERQKEITAALCGAQQNTELNHDG